LSAETLDFTLKLPEMDSECNDVKHHVKIVLVLLLSLLLLYAPWRDISIQQWSQGLGLHGKVLLVPCYIYCKRIIITTER